MILTIENIKEYLPLNSIEDGTLYEKFEIRALYKYLPKYMGDALVEIIYDFGTPAEDSVSSELDPDTEDMVRLIDALKPVLANLTILESIPQFNLVATGYGFGIVSNPNQAPASMDRVRDLKDSCLQAANDGLDRLLMFLENHADKYTKWNKSCINTGSLIPSAAVYDQFIDINCSRRRFVDLKRHINFEELTNFSNIFSTEFISALRTGTDTAVKPIIQQALAWSAEIQFQRATNPTADVSYWMNKYVTALSNAMAYLRTHLDAYPVYAEKAYEKPYDNGAEDNDSGFFIGGITG